MGVSILLFELGGHTFGVPFNMIEQVMKWSFGGRYVSSIAVGGKKYRVVSAGKLFFGRQNWKNMTEVLLFSEPDCAVPVERSLNLVEVDGSVILPVPPYLFEEGKCFYRGFFPWEGKGCLLINDRLLS